MSTYQIHTIASAPEQSKPMLEQLLQQACGITPNLAAAISNSPKLATAFLSVFQQAFREAGPRARGEQSENR
jgi:hypothetical protein